MKAIVHIELDLVESVTGANGYTLHSSFKFSALWQFSELPGIKHEILLGYILGQERVAVIKKVRWQKKGNIMILSTAQEREETSASMPHLYTKRLEISSGYVSLKDSTNQSLDQNRDRMVWDLKKAFSVIDGVVWAVEGCD